MKKKKNIGANPTSPFTSHKFDTASLERAKELRDRYYKYRGLPPCKMQDWLSKLIADGCDAIETEIAA